MNDNKKQLSGGARLIASGRSPVALALTSEQKATAKRAAESEGRSLANFFLFHGLQAAEKILAKKPKLS